MSTKRSGTTKKILLLAGTTVGPTPTRSSAYSANGTRGAGTFTLKGVFAGAAVAKGKPYVVTLVAKATNGKTTTIQVRFTG